MKTADQKPGKKADLEAILDEESSDQGRVTFVPEGDSSLLAPAMSVPDPVAPVISGVGHSIDAAFGNMFGTEEAIVTAPTINGEATEEIEIEQGAVIDIDDLPDYLRDDVHLDQAFHTWEHGGTSEENTEIEAEAAPVPEPTLSTKNAPTMPAPAATSALINPPPTSFDVDFDEADFGPRAGVFRIPNLLPPNISLTSPTTQVVPTDISEKETMAPPPLANYPDSEVPVSIESPMEDRNTADYTEDAKILWAFMESNVYKKYQADLEAYQKAVKTKPDLIEPDMVNYLACFSANYHEKE